MSEPLRRGVVTVPLGETTAEVALYASASGCAPISQDAWTLSAHPGLLRLAVCDGVTPTRSTPYVGGLDGAAWAARVTAATLELPLAAPDALQVANDQLRALPGVLGLRLRDRPQTVAAVADLRTAPEGCGLVLTVAGDCQAFALTDGAWTEHCAGPVLTPAAEAAALAWLAEHPELRDPVDDVVEAYEAVLASPDAWVTTPIGLFETVRTESASFEPDEWDAVVIATDGARLAPERLTDLDGWLEGLREVEALEFAGEFKPHDDVVVLRVSNPGRNRRSA